ncbi:unnamed protein product [Adineta steineri]|uniref:Uncharacterized protein n=1 Tax=Adineta steineri TaxID=433720 RepID=A0A820BEH6_9BILA|nr:unnamed protein product [Adineta steineri]
MNISSTLSNLYFNEYYYESSTFSAYTTDQLYYNYHKTSTEIEQSQHNLSVSSRSQSSSLSSDRQVITSSNKKSKVVIQRKQLKLKHRRASIDRSDKKKDKLKRLYKEYSDENLYEHWKLLRTQQCSELYQYALDKYHQIE